MKVRFACGKGNQRAISSLIKSIDTSSLSSSLKGIRNTEYIIIYIYISFNVVGYSVFIIYKVVYNLYKIYCIAYIFQYIYKRGGIMVSVTHQRKTEAEPKIIIEPFILRGNSCCANCGRLIYESELVSALFEVVSEHKGGLRTERDVSVSHVCLQCIANYQKIS